MSIIDNYYNKLLSIVNLKYAGIKTLDKDDFNMKDIISNIIEAGNEFILSDVYLYCFVNRAVEYSDFKSSLLKSLMSFATTDKDIILENLVSFYNDIYYFNEVDYYFHNLSKIGDFIEKNQIPLLKELKESCNIIDTQLDISDYFVIRDILFIILSYCIMNDKEDCFQEYTYNYIDYPRMIIDSLLLNDIIMEREDPVTHTFNYVVKSEELRKYIISKLDKTKTKIIK